MFGITDLSTYIIGTILIVILPGPNSLYVMSIASRFGTRIGYLAALGVFTGDLILILCTIFGAASLLHSFPWLFIILKVVGAAYLSYLGSWLIIASIRTWQGTTAQSLESSNKSITYKEAQPYRTALTISILNPKAILFYLSFFVQFVDPNYAYPAISFTLMSIILQIISMLYLSMLIFSGVRFAAFFNQRYRLTSVAVAIVGFAFLGFGMKLAFSTV
ncbi:leucine efflux protein LeuE [Acinetobacter sp. ANC 4178]|uniref:leucine efflux protein LeuE n=1 Tax=Acinetobacter sp. ANC 4178 TaxID=2529839 RepID=UPI0010390462|nr:leucine efflux protein LeuE [Acinetobacter sp. ANC 4178]TCB68445.1 leucine efflux protein LeuE [Acinetobacter sp. ANC 4178]